MKNKEETALNNFLLTETEEELDKKVKENEKEIVKDNSIIERIDKVFIVEKNGKKKQLLREVY